MVNNLQVDQHGRLHHLLGIRGLPRNLLEEVLNRAANHARIRDEGVKALPLLHGKTVVNLFFEPSTRTRTTFELAAKRLSADVINLQIDNSSQSKGETLLDTLKTLEAMHVNLFVVRHQSSGAAHFFARHTTEDVSVLNAGDGCHEHPTQALLDIFTLKEHLQKIGADFKDIRVAIVGDVLHSRVARSDIYALQILGVKEIRVVGPRTLVPPNIVSLGVQVFHSLNEGLDGVDIAMLLRLQKERMTGALLPSPQEFHEDFGLTRERLRALGNRLLIMHPGPINRGIEIEGSLAYADRSLILEQVRNGLAVRMAVMGLILRPEIRGNLYESDHGDLDPGNRKLQL